MRHVRPSEARRRWFELLDDVIAGEEVVIERKGRRIIMRAESAAGPQENVPDYSDVIRGCVDDADQWAWGWTKGSLEPRETR